MNTTVSNETINIVKEMLAGRLRGLATELADSRSHLIEARCLNGRKGCVICWNNNLEDETDHHVVAMAHLDNMVDDVIGIADKHFILVFDDEPTLRIVSKPNGRLYGEAIAGDIAVTDHHPIFAWAANYYVKY